MNKILNEIKDKVYEAEGLLELLQLRGDRLEDLRPLILSRIDEARALIVSLAGEERAKPVADKPVADKREPVESPATQALENAIDQPREVKENTEVKTEAEDQASESHASAEQGNGVASVSARPAFCLNDRFRFRRSIFAGSQDDFNMAMDHLATLDSYEEAEEFFIEEMALDPEDQDVMDFMAIIKEYFGQ